MIDRDTLLRWRERLWDFEAVGRYPQYGLRLARYGYVLVRDLLDGQISMRAMSLVYTTLLSLVPVLALGFSVLKAFGVHNSLEPTLLELLRPLGGQAGELSRNIIGFVEKIQVGVLGSVGVALLFYAALSMIQKIEEAFNYIWRIERTRSLGQRLGEYLGVLLVGPAALVLSSGMTTSALSSELMMRITAFEPFGFFVYLLTRLLPYVLIIGAFTFLYSFVPNTRVRLKAAAAGGLLAGVLWQTGSALFAGFVSAATNYNAIYSGFAILIFLLIWLYVGWLILLIGCHVAFHVQHPEHLKPHKVPPLLSGKETEYLALMVMALTGRRFMAGEPGYTHEELALALHAQPEHVSRVVATLEFNGLLTIAGADGTRLIPAIDLDSIALSRLWRLARAGSEPLPRVRDELGRRALRLVEDAEAAFERNTGELSLRQWLLAQETKR